MKKTIVTLLALAGVAAADTITLWPNVTTGTLVSGDNIYNNTPFNGATNYTTEDLKSIIDQIDDPTTEGWYYGVGQGQSSVNGDLTLETNGFKFKARSGFSHEFVLAFVEAPDDTVTLTMKFDSDKNVSASIWKFDKETEEITLLLGKTESTVGTTFSEKVENLKLGSNDMIVFAWSSSATGGAGSGAEVTVSNVSMIATTAPIPEPATATLSLLALAGLAARRRRK